MSNAMTAEKWNAMSKEQRDNARDLSGLVPLLVGLEGWRVELVYYHNGERFTERGIVSRSTGWRPCHILLKRRDSYGGGGVSAHNLFGARKLYRVR